MLRIFSDVRDGGAAVAKLERFGQIWLDISEIWGKLRQKLGKSD